MGKIEYRGIGIYLRTNDLKVRVWGLTGHSDPKLLKQSYANMNHKGFNEEEKEEVLKGTGATVQGVWYVCPKGG